jgi:hypothetical protein
MASPVPRAGVVLRAGGNGAENGRLTSEKQREIAKILLQTQKNMLELNNSRVKVQEELAMAHRRIADLGACVSDDRGAVGGSAATRALGSVVAGLGLGVECRVQGWGLQAGNRGIGASKTAADLRVVRGR